MKFIKNNPTAMPLIKSTENNSSDAPNPIHDFVLNHHDAEAASPDYTSVGGEEDPGDGLEFLVSEEEK